MFWWEIGFDGYQFMANATPLRATVNCYHLILTHYLLLMCFALLQQS